MSRHWGSHPHPTEISHEADNRRYGTLLLNHLRELFGIIHDRAYYTSEVGFRLVLAGQRDRLVAAALQNLPDTHEARDLAKRFAEQADSYFRFITEPDVDPTNNLAEQAIRFVAIHRRMTQGTRGEKGRRWCERLWTVATTCVQQGRSAFDFLLEAVQAHLKPWGKCRQMTPDWTDFRGRMMDGR